MKNKLLPTKQALHHLVDHLPDSEMPAAERFLEYLVLHALRARFMGTLPGAKAKSHVKKQADPVLQALASAPVDTEPLAFDEWDAMWQAMGDIAQGKGIPDAALSKSLKS